MEALGINVKIILVQIANFAILLFILKRFLYKPILNMLERRQKDAEDALVLKSTLEKKVAETEQERQQVLQNTKSETDQIMSEARQKGERMAIQVEQSAKEKADHMLAKATEEAQNKEGELRAELKNEVASVAISVAEQVLQTSLDEKSKHAITQESVRRFVQDAK